MLKKITILSVAILSIFSGFAQKADWEKVDVTYTRLPLKPVSPMAKKYSLEINMDSDGIAKNRIETRDALVKSVTNTNALLVKQGKTPQPYPDDYDYYPADRTPTSIKTALKIDGCQEVQSAAEFSIKLNVSGFDFTGNKVVSSNQSTSTGTVKVYGYEVGYVYKVTYQVYDAAGTLVREEVLGGTDKPRTKKTKTFPTEAELESWWTYTDEAKAFKATCDNDAYSNAISVSKNQLNSEFGYSVKTVKFDVATAKDAAVYGDIISAYTEASMGYNYLSTDKAKAKDYLLKAVAIWEKALKESNLTDKKARINENITNALHVNLAAAYCFLEDWPQSNHNLVKLKSADLGGGLKNKLEDAEAFKKDYEARVKANIVE
ncbi:hypothetical protein [Cytophaga hutchinsonii]|uniref:Tetratricopeptide repeat protein n=1 Tax=Cytophaga hutchinsonii (strain ATCC 33406 / DSM 1761 / CIP 103989 / NBRC 15051 / NCIMB 9469 / D465) TaxID=269798 RepID=A0A6N4SWC2_CYTH3|nr:hypothetical protein [Cytophaga hutchinsonii]ABG60927.1 hypothetical protein CHU_3694 [Cytophaga hutchinsonii ATCC 33406]SFX42628.1 hypothetical protein SAMN04487930_10441 [Cytophaga hutchinsonii ATCC 33406]